MHSATLAQSKLEVSSLDNINNKNSWSFRESTLFLGKGHGIPQEKGISQGARLAPCLVGWGRLRAFLEQKYRWCHVPEIISVGFFLGKKPAGSGASHYSDCTSALVSANRLQRRAIGNHQRGAFDRYQMPALEFTQSAGHGFARRTYAFRNLLVSQSHLD